MPLSVFSLPPVPQVRTNFSLFVVALVTGLAFLVSPGQMYAQTTASCSTTPTGAQYANTGTITTPNELTNPDEQNSPYTPYIASPYPSTINVPGSVTGTVTGIQVRLNSVSATGNSSTNPNANALSGMEVLLVSPSGTEMEIMGNVGSGLANNSDPDVSGLTILIGDGTGFSDAPNGGLYANSGTICWAPSAYTSTGEFSSPVNTSAIRFPQTAGKTTPATLSNSFNGATAAGNWSLYVVDDFGNPDTIVGWDLFLTVNETTVGTTTVVSPSLQPAYTSGANSSVTFTATVSSNAGTPSGGTVAFSANGTPISCGGGNQTLSGGQATCTTTLSTQGLNSIQATYSGSGSYQTSSGTMDELVEAHAAQSSNTWCNSGPIVSPDIPAVGMLYPSVITVPSSAYTAGTTVASVTVELNGETATTQNNGFNDQFLVVAPDGTHNLDILDEAFAGNGISDVSITVSDSGANPYDLTPTNDNTYLPYDGNINNPNDTWASSTAPTYDSNIPQVPGTINRPQTVGGTNAKTLEEAFSGAPAIGDWALYVYGYSPNTLNNGWCLDFTLNTGAATTTVVSSTQQKATTGQSVTITATVKSGDNPVSSGTVTIVDTTTGATLVSAATPNGNGQVSYGPTTAFTEGDHQITATYTPGSGYDASFGSIVQRVDDATVVTNVTGDEWNYCNTGPVQIQNGTKGAYTPNPSNVFVTGFPGQFESAAVLLNNFTLQQTAVWESASLIEGPNGAALDFFSNIGGPGNEVATQGNYVLEDSASSPVPYSPEGSSSFPNVTPGSYKPSAYPPFETSTDTFTSSASGFYNVPGTFALAATQGSATFSSVFPDTLNPNGTWSLFFNQFGEEESGASGAANGWCMQLTGTPPAVSVTAAHSGSGTGNDFAQGQQGAELTVVVKNNGPGSTGDPSGGNFPMTVTDTLNSAFTYANGSGTGWTCSANGQTVTCTNDSPVALSDSYPDLTINVNVSATASGSVSNSVTASGAGVASTNSNTDSIVVVPSPFLGVSTTPIGTFTQGSTAEWDIAVINTVPGSATSGTVTVVDTLPSGYAVSSFGTDTGWNCSGTTTVTCTSTTSVAGGSSFPTIQILVSVPAASLKSVTNNVVAYGGGDQTQTNSGNGATAFSTITVVQVPATITANAGTTPQSAMVSTAFANALAVTVKDANGVAISGASVTFTAPPLTGASGTFSNSSNTIIVPTGSGGTASAGVFTANATAGGPYNVTATAGSQSTSFSLTNTLPQFVLTTAANPSIGGTVTPTSGGSYGQGTSVPLTALPAAGYVFTGWTSSPDSVASPTSASTSITMNAAESVTANFTAFASAAATTTTLGSSPNPSFTAPPNNSVTFTAAVSSGGNPVTVGTVEFSSGGGDLPNCSAVAVDGTTGQAQCTDSFAAEGTLTITATYSGYSSISASYLTSFGTVGQEVDNHTVQNGNQFCNTGTIGVPNASGAATPYPSRILVTGYTGNIGKLTVQLNGINSSDTQPTDLLLMGPTDAHIIPFAGVGNATTISGVNITLDDAAADLLGSSTLTTGTFKPTSMTGGTSLVFPAPAPLVDAANYAATDGSATLSSIFNNTAPNGTWSLFAKANAGSGADSISGGWCVTITPSAAPVITSANSANVNLNAALSLTVTTTGTPTPSITEGGQLPTGVTFHDNGDGTASLSGTPSVGGTFPLVFTASNGAGPDAVQDFTLNVGTPPAITSGSSTTFATGTAGTFTVTATGNPTPTISESGTLPTGVTFSGGVLSGTPTQSGSFSISFTASNGVTPNPTQSFTLTVDQAPAITSASSTTFATGSLGSFTVTATGFPTPTISEVGTLPTGVSFSGGVLSGTPTQTGSFPITFSASNGVTPNATQSFTLTVNQAPGITSANNTTFVTGNLGTFTVTAIGFPTPTISESGTLPTGVTFSGGVLSGTPTQSGSFSISFTASNGVTPNATQSFSLTVDQAPAITSASSTTFATGTLSTFSVTATGFPAPTISEVGTLPTGVTFSGGTLSGTPTQSGSFPIAFHANNGIGTQATQSFTLTVNQAPAITSANNTIFATGTLGTFTVTASGFPTPTISEVGTLPTGVSFSGGVLSGTPTQSGSFSISFTASNGVTPNATQSFTLTVDQAPAITSASSTTFVTGTLNTFTVTTTGFPVPTVSEVGTLPTGVTFSGGTLSGTPTQSGTFPITFHANNGIGTQATQSFTLTVNQAPAITSANNTTFVTGTLGSFTVMATGFPAPTISEVGTLPTGVTFSGGKLSGTPIQSGSFPISFTASNGFTPNATQSFTLTVDQAPAITSANHAAFTLGAASSFTVTTTGFPVPTSITELGSLPAGVTFTNNGNGTATLAGTPTTGGTFNIGFTASNGVSPNATQSFTLTASGPLANVSPSTLSFGTVYLGSLTPKTVTLTNTGNAAMTINDPLLSIAKGGDSKEFVVLSLCPRSLAAGKSCTIIVTFVAGPFFNPQTATLSIVDNVPGSPQQVTMTALVIDPLALPNITNWSFGTQKVNTSSAPKVITLSNPGLTALAINSITIAGANFSDFSETNNCPASLAPKGGCTIDVTFKPTAKGFRSSSVVITDNAFSNPQKISLSGTGN